MPETQFSLRSITAGSRSPFSGVSAEVEEETPITGQATPNLAGADSAVADPLDPTVETQRRISGSGSGAGQANQSSISWPSLLARDPATRDLEIAWQPPHPSAPDVPAPAGPATRSQPTTELVAPPLPKSQPSTELVPPPPEANEQVEVSTPVAEASAPAATGLQTGVPLAPKPVPRRLNPWTVVAGIPVFLLVGYLVLLPVGFYGYRIIQARQTDSVTLVADLGHGGESQVTVLFTPDDWLQVTEIDNNDPTRVTELSVTQMIALADNKVVVEAQFQAILQPGRLDLIIQLDSGQAFQPAFTTILINNVTAVKKNPHAPGLRAPTASELQLARQKLGI
ncbi:MAG TPA: hypothetical protein VKT82_24990 [Ktedonobacterales bacterium]|nr:hypothetical protein [Ktedonobacterales bacterium]